MERKKKWLIHFLLSLVIVCFYVGIRTEKVNAADLIEYPSYYFNGSCFTNLGNALHSPSGIYATCSAGYFSANFATYDFSSLPIAYINSITVLPQYDQNQPICLIWYNGTTPVTSGYCSDYSNSNLLISPVLTSGMTTYSYKWLPGWTEGSDNFTEIANLFFANTVGIKIRYENNPGNINLESMGIDVNYNLPATPSATLDITDLTADASAGTINFNASGDTGFTQSGEVCDVNLYEQDPLGILVSNSNIDIHMDASNSITPPSIFLLPNRYLAYEFTSTVSAWEADNISMPYVPTENTKIVGTTVCFHYDGSGNKIFDINSQGLNSQVLNYNPDLIATPSATQVMTGTNTSSNPDNLLSDTWIPGIFSMLGTKAPFSYASAIWNGGQTLTASDSAIPTITIPITHTTGGVASSMPTGMTWTDTGSGNNNVLQIATMVKTSFTLMLDLILVFYFIGAVRRMFT